MDKKVEEYLKYFDQGYSQEIIDYATNVMLKESRYIFVTTIKKQQYGYCTHCYSEFKTHLPKPTEKQAFEIEQSGCHIGYMNSLYENKKHGQKMICPVCKSTCTVRYSGLGHSRLLDSAYFVYYEKSVLDPKVIVARGITAVRDYTSDYKNIKTDLYTDYYYIFEYGKGGKMIKFIYRWNGSSGWGFAKKVYSQLYNQPSSYKKVDLARDSIRSAVENTPFAWSGWEKHDYHDMVEFFDLFARYPVVEYLNKLGYENLIKEKLNGRSTWNAVNWRGKTLLKVLRLTEAEYQVIKQQKINLDSWFLRLLKVNRDNQLGLKVPEVKQLSQLIYGEGELDTIKRMITRDFKFRDVFKYIVKQLSRSNHRYYGASTVARDWLDYREECIKLGMDINDIRVLYPKDLYQAHQNTTAQIKYAEDAALSEKIRQRLPELQVYNFSKDGLFIRPAKSAFELVEEGKALNHCVGRYSKDYAEGKTIILVIRKESEPDKPYYTMEIKDNKIIQTRGLSNILPDNLVSEFVKSFEESKLKKTKTRNKKTKKLAIPA